jgi:nitroreductase
MHGLMGVGHAVQNVLLAATIRGLGVGYVGTFDPPPPHEFERALSIEMPFSLLMVLPIGYPAENRPSQSKDISKIVSIID